MQQLAHHVDFFGTFIIAGVLGTVMGLNNILSGENDLYQAKNIKLLKQIQPKNEELDRRQNEIDSRQKIIKELREEIMIKDKVIDVLRGKPEVQKSDKDLDV